MKNYYDILGVTYNATSDEIAAAKNKLAKKYHPDRNPGDQEAARKMQEINAAYEQIKNPDKTAQQDYDPFRGSGDSSDQYQQAAEQYIRFRRYREALTVLQNCTRRDAQWYYLSALANDGLGNQVTALEHIRKAVSMEPDNYAYLQALEMMEHGGSVYRQHAGSYRTFQFGQSPCLPFCLCYILQLFCCRGIYCC